MGFFDRVGQVLKGKASNAAGDIENAHPAAVYEAAIADRERNYGQLKKAGAGLVVMRDQKQEALAKAQRELDRLEPAIAMAVNSGEDEAALALLQQKETLSSQVATLGPEITSLEAQVKESMSALRSYKDEIGKLKREKTEMLARNQTAEARIQVQETMSGLSQDADVQGLASVRDYIHGLESDAGIDTASSGVSDSDLALSKAKLKLAALKRQMGAQPDGASATEDADAPAEAGAPASEEAGADAPEAVPDDTPKRTL